MSIKISKAYGIQYKLQNASKCTFLELPFWSPPSSGSKTLATWPAAALLTSCNLQQLQGKGGNSTSTWQMLRTLLSLTRPCRRYCSIVAHRTLYVYTTSAYSAPNAKKQKDNVPPPRTKPSVLLDPLLHIHDLRHNILSQIPLEALLIECRVQRLHQSHHLCRLVLIEPWADGLHYAAEWRNDRIFGLVEGLAERNKL